MFYEVPTPPGALRRTSSIVHKEPTHERQFCVMGETLQLQTNHTALLDIAADAFGRYGEPQSLQQEDEQPLVLCILVDEGAHARHRNAQHAITGHSKPVVRTHGHLLYLGVGAENSLVVDLRAGFAYAHLTPCLLDDPAFVRYTFVEAAAQALLGMTRGYVALHAACVVKDGVSVMLKAQAGTGKSTLAFACLHRGYQVLAEDVVQIKVQPHGVELWGMPWKFHLLRDSLRFFPKSSAELLHMQVNGEWKIEVELDALFPQATVTRADPGLLVLLERDDAGQHKPVESLLPEEARAAVDVIWSWQEGWSDHYEQQISRHLLRHVYRLHMNGSPFDAVDALDALVAQHKESMCDITPSDKSCWYKDEGMKG